MPKLKGKAALVVGGAGYLGSRVSEGLVKNGASVLIADLALDRAQTLVEEINRLYPKNPAKAMTMDTGNESSIKKGVAEAVSSLGKLNVLVNLSFTSSDKTVEELNAKDFDRCMRINLTGGFLLAREAMTAMKNGGSVVMFSSMYGKSAPDPGVYPPPMKPNPIHYGVAKAGILQMVRYLAVYWAKNNIRVNAIVPGPFPSPAAQRRDPEFIRRLGKKVPLGRIGRPEEIVGAVLFLVSDEASYITGEAINVDGGWNIW